MSYSSSFIRNVELLGEKTYKEAWWSTFWGGLAGIVKISGPEGQQTYQPSGKIIEVQNQALTQGRDHILMPFEVALSGEPKYGDVALSGTGESMAWKWARGYMNAIRHAVLPKEGNMSELRGKTLRQMDKARPQLAEYFGKLLSMEVNRAILEGASGNLTATTANGGIALNKRYNPNFYINDGGVLTAVGTAGTCPTAANITTGAGNCDTAMTASILRDLRVKCLNLRIPQIETKNGYKFWLMIVHPSQLMDLHADSAFQAIQNAASTGKMLDNIALTGASAYYEGFVLVEDITAVRGWNTTNTEFFGESGATPFLSAISPTTETKYCAMVVGPSAVGKANGSGFKFSMEDTDHEAIKEVGGTLITGFNRFDYVTEAVDATAYAKSGSVSNVVAKNQSSLILMTT